MAIVPDVRDSVVTVQYHRRKSTTPAGRKRSVRPYIKTLLPIKAQPASIGHNSTLSISRTSSIQAAMASSVCPGTTSRMGSKVMGSTIVT